MSRVTVSGRARHTWSSASMSVRWMSMGGEEWLRAEVKTGLTSAATLDDASGDVEGSAGRRTGFGPTTLSPTHDSAGEIGDVDHGEISSKPSGDRSCRHDCGPETLERE